MTQRIKVGKVYLEIPVETTPTLEFPGQPLLVKAEKPEMPEPLEQQDYIYRPNDPFQYAIDEARAIAGIGASHKPWVKKAWFIIFIIGPLLYAALNTLAVVLHSETSADWTALTGANFFLLPIWLIYLAIWYRTLRKTRFPSPSPATPHPEST